MLAKLFYKGDSTVSVVSSKTYCSDVSTVAAARRAYTCFTHLEANDDRPRLDRIIVFYNEFTTRYHAVKLYRSSVEVAFSAGVVISPNFSLVVEQEV